MRKLTGIKDMNGVEIRKDDIVCFPAIDKNVLLIVTYIGDGDGDDMDWAADKNNGDPDSWLDNTCEIVGKKN